MPSPREVSTAKAKVQHQIELGPPRLCFAAFQRWAPISTPGRSGVYFSNAVAFSYHHLTRYSSGSAPQRTAWYRRRPQVLRYRWELTEQSWRTRSFSWHYLHLWRKCGAKSRYSVSSRDETGITSLPIYTRRGYLGIFSGIFSKLASVAP